MDVVPGFSVEVAVDVAEQVFGRLPGRWTLSRVMHPDKGTASGSATFTPAGPGRLHYREDVEVRLPGGYVGEAYREYEYVLEQTLIRVLLADGTTMHLLAFAQEEGGDVWTAADIHDCRADQYRGTYRMGPGDHLTVDMKVDGPAKDYRIVTEYGRA
ncbi:DUF6314 family protein [Kineosporia sp. NBRC 101731]|uniref:DUF6314 family protein n=1 Tax=Kineosporia sp. NBRC 101731 TaxID=3032199 RepID=UPI0024A1F8B3|nr:DUF6314 family protein [Kineosporia sp. NBRC 101731]GLY30188.1 hypothetical protein Kisp02_35530 [Kineosporia sp. NBRC 101731]